VIARVVAISSIAFAFAYSRAARAAEPPPKKIETTFDSSSLLNRPHTIASIEVGAVILPSAPISAANQGGDTPLGGIGHGDATLQTGLHLLYRATRDYAIGAGAMFAPKPTSDSQYSSASGGITRTHTRSYMVLGLEGRYFPLRYRWFEAWFGADVGVVVIADRFATQGAAVPTILGTREYTVRTEGFTVGVAVGGDYIITDNWVVGLAVRLDRWILPNATNNPLTDPACSSIGDCPTLTGTVAAIQIGIALGYRIPL
jgi:hypothetical protein